MWTGVASIAALRAFLGAHGPGKIILTVGERELLAFPYVNSVPRLGRHGIVGEATLSSVMVPLLLICSLMHL